MQDFLHRDWASGKGRKALDLWGRFSMMSPHIPRGSLKEVRLLELSFEKDGNGTASAAYWQKASNLVRILAEKGRFAMMKKGKIYEELLVLADAKNAGFVQRLIPNLAPERILGTKTPILRTFAKQLAKRPECEAFLKELPHFSFEEHLVHGFVIEELKDFEQTMEALERYLPFIDNRATCDQLRPKILAKHADEVLVKIRGWLGSEHPYTVRYAIGLLMTNYLDEEFEPGLLQLVAEVDREHYYIQMMQAWYFATALAKQPASTLPLIESQTLIPFVQNKTIQKARESRRISPELKKSLLAWKITEKGKG